MVKLVVIGVRRRWNPELPILGSMGTACSQGTWGDGNLEAEGAAVATASQSVNCGSWHPTPVLLPRKSHGWRSLEGCSPWGR